ncbi:MAG: hydrogenase iron-sulfur subunit [bacterium]
MSPETEEGNFHPQVIVLYCQGTATEEDFSDSSRQLDECTVRTIVVPCSSKVEIGLLVKMLHEGVDGITVVGCEKGACRFKVGTAKATGKVNYVRNMLEQLGLGLDRTAMVRGRSLSFDDLLELGRERAKAVKELGPNPMKP